MPRKPKALPATVAPGQTYGVGQDQLAQQAALPLPDNRTPVPTAAAQADAGGMRRPLPTGPRPVDMEQALAMAQAMPFNEVGMGGPSRHPNQPVTTGSPLGPGAGPEAIPQIYAARHRTAQVFEVMAQVNGSPRLRVLAERLKGR